MMIYSSTTGWVGRYPLWLRSSARLRAALLSTLLVTPLAAAEDPAPPPSTPQPVAPLIAEQITPGSATRHVQRGLDAAGGIGDWALSNGILCAIVSDPGHESDLSASGGALIDLGFCDRDDDQFVVTQDLRNGSLSSPINMHSIAAQTGTDEVSLLVLGGANGLLQETRLAVDRAVPERLRVQKRIIRRTDDAPGVRLLTPVLFNYGSLETFLLDSREPGRSVGFAQIGFSSQGVSAFAKAARRNDTIVAIAGPHSAQPIAYGWRMVDVRKRSALGDWETLPFFAASDAAASVFMVMTDPFLLDKEGDPGLTQMLQIALMGLAEGETLLIEEEFWIGRRGDVAAITDHLYPDAPLRSGRVDPSVRGVQIRKRTGRGAIAPFSFVRPDAAGNYALRLPDGDYEIKALGAAARSKSVTVQLDPSHSTLPLIELAAPAVLELPRGEAMRLVFRGRNGTPDPDLQNTLTGFRVTADDVDLGPAPVPMVFLAGIDSDRATVALPPGDYRIYGTRGIEYRLSSADVTMVAGRRQALELAPPQRAVATPGFIAADLHVHSGPSMDNAFAVRERVRTFVAEHGEVLVATEHETLFDFAPLLKEMAVDDQIASINGTEMTGQVPTARLPHTAGHANFFPLEPQPLAFRRGVPANEGRRLREVLYAVRQQAPTVFAQLNHARSDDGFLRNPPRGDVSERIDNGAYLDHMGPAAFPYDPREPLTTGANQTLIEPDPTTGVRDIDFDGIEILNGKRDASPGRRQALLADWFSLLLQGERLIGTANSDSHGKHQQVALPRNMVGVGDDSIDGFDESRFIEALRSGRSYGTTGPLLTVSLDDAGLGAMHRGATGTLRVHVQHADWIATDELRVLVNGEEVRTVDLTSVDDGKVQLELEFPGDCFIVVEVEGEASEAYAAVFPGHSPYAFSNPIYVDANADGKWSPPGL